VNSSLRSLLLTALAALILVNAAAGVIALASGGSDGFDEVEGRMIMTTLVLTAAGFALLPCVIAWETGRLSPSPWLGVPFCACNVATAGLVIAGIWREEGEDSFWRAGGSLVVVALTLSYGCLVSLLGTRAGQVWLRLLTLALAATLAAEVVAAIFIEGLDTDGYFRAIGITAIVTLTTSILLPVMQRISPLRAPVPTRVAANFCPVCGAATNVSSGSGTCPGCGARFRIDFLSAG
jgi:hypothetical protein